MTFIDKCKAAGIGDGSAHEGYPVINGKVLSKRNGSLKAFTRRESPKPWEDPLIEDKSFSATTIKKILDLATGTDVNLSIAEKQAIEDAEAAEDERVNAPSLVELDKRLKVLEAGTAK